MGVEISIPLLQRKKSLSNIGRSSQRSLFQKYKIKLKQIQKKLEDANKDELKSELDSIETELGNISGAIKDKNKEKYDSIIQQLQEARQQFDEKFEPQDKSIEIVSRFRSVEENPNSNKFEEICFRIDKLKNDLDHFQGDKGDSDYNQLQENFQQILDELINYDVNEDPVLNQNKKILIHRIKDWMTILEHMGDQ